MMGSILAILINVNAIKFNATNTWGRSNWIKICQNESI